MKYAPPPWFAACRRVARDVVYLDWNATSPPHPDVLAAMQWAAQEAWANPSSVHEPGRLARHVVETVRGLLSGLIDVHPRDIVLTSGGTEANNLALRDAPSLVTSRLEHPSITREAEEISRLGREVRWVAPQPDGTIGPQDVAAALQGLPVGTQVAVSAVNHETGVVQSLRDIAAVVHAAGARLHVDGVQALGKLDLATWNCWDSLSLAAHKIRGPKGIGALAWRCGRTAPRPIMLGGAQERGIRAGTVDPVLAAGFGAALARVANGPARLAAVAALRDELENGLTCWAQSNVAPHVHRVGHVASLCFTGWRADELVAALDLEGVCVSSGSACGAGNSEPSPVIAAMLGVQIARSSIRVSLGETTTQEDIDRATKTIMLVARQGGICDCPT